MLAKTITALSVTTCLLGLSGAAAIAASDNDVVFLSAAQVRDAVAKTAAGLATQDLPTGSDATVVSVHRDADGEVEVHTKKHDVIVTQGGRGAILVGGKADGQRATAPDEWRGGKITGGTTYQLNPGDVLWIPAGIPHQMLVAKGGSLNYLAFKYDLQGAKSP